MRDEALVNNIKADSWTRLKVASPLAEVIAESLKAGTSGEVLKP